MRARFREAQARLGMLVAMERTRYQDPRSEADRARATPVLDEAAAAGRAGDDDRALALLAAAEAQEISDPRIPFQRGELLAARGRQREAIAAWRHAIALDPSVGLAYYRVGLAHRHLGERHMATYYLEQAERRFEPGGRFRKRTQQALRQMRRMFREGKDD